MVHAYKHIKITLCTSLLCSGDKHRDLYSLNHPQMQQRQRHNSWAGLHASVSCHMHTLITCMQHFLSARVLCDLDICECSLPAFRFRWWWRACTKFVVRVQVPAEYMPLPEQGEKSEGSRKSPFSDIYHQSKGEVSWCDTVEPLYKGHSE